MEKICVVYTLNNIEQYEYFKLSFITFLNKNWMNNDKINYLILVGHDNKLINKLNKIFKYFSLENYEIFVLGSKKIDNDILSSPNIWWLFSPVISPKTKYFLFLDNDTIVNANIFSSFVLNNLDEDRIFFWRKSSLTSGWKGYKHIKEGEITKKSLIYGNSGFVFLNGINFREKYGENIEDVECSIRKNGKINRAKYDDELFILNTSGNKDISFVKNTLNITKYLVSVLDEEVKSEDFVLHFMGRDAKKILYPFILLESIDKGYEPKTVDMALNKMLKISKEILMNINVDFSNLK